MDNKNSLDKEICFEYEKLFGLKNALGEIVFDDLLRKFSHANGAFVNNDENNRLTIYNLGQQSVINYIIAQINKADKSIK